MDISWRSALLVVAGAFVVFLIAKMLPGASSRDTSSPGLAGAKARVRDAASARERAIALCDAGDAALSLSFGATRAAAYFMRAMRADPTWAGSVDRAAAALVKRRARMLEKLLWRRLAAIPWDAEHAEVTRALVLALAAASKHIRGHKGHADALARIAAGEAFTFPLRGEGGSSSG